MMRRPWMLSICAISIAVFTAAESRAAETRPEALLSAESVGYLRYDGLATHREAYQKTSFAKTIDEEFQPLIDSITKLILDAIGPQVLGEKLLDGARPGELIKLQKAVRQLPVVAGLLKERGFTLGVEVIDPQKSQFQITIVFSGGKPAENSAILGAFRLLAYASEQKLTEAKVDGRNVLQFEVEKPVNLHCWKEGAHVVLTIGTETPQRTIALANGKRKSLAGTKLFKRVAGFRDYETWIRGFVNVAETLSAIEKAVPPAKGVVQVLGINGLSDVSFHLGFEGQLQRSTVFLATPGERKGLLKLIAAKKPLDLQRLLKMPPDAVSASAVSADFPLAYDEIMKAAKIIATIANPIGRKSFETIVSDFEKSIGVNIKQDIINSLGATVATYTSASEGPLNLGVTFAVEVKDEPRLRKALETLGRSLASISGADVSLAKRKYRGATLNMLQINERGFPFVPTYTIHKGWLVIGLMPQSVQGYVYRSSGKAATWKSPVLLSQAVQATLKTRGGKRPRLVGVGVADPRPAVKQVLSVAPLIVAFIRSFSGAISDFDLSLIPNAQAVTERLSENVTVIVDDGNGVRIEGYASMPFPTQLTGIDAYGYLAVLSFAQLGF